MVSCLERCPQFNGVPIKGFHCIMTMLTPPPAGTVPVNSRGEKQRVHLRDSFLGDQIDPIYVAYNL